MSLFFTSIKSYWASQSSLTALIPATNVYPDVAANGASMPYAIYSQVGAKMSYSTGANYIHETKFQITIYAVDGASMDAIASAVKTAYKFADLGSTGFVCYLENEIPRAENGGAFSCTLVFRSMENES